MTDIGTPSVLPRPGSHTSTQQWQSFEFRMRHRRAERCRLRAQVALEAGFVDDAREALDEARRLDPSSEILHAELERQIAAGPAEPVPVPAPRRRQRYLWVATGALAVAGALALQAWRTPEAGVPVRPARPDVVLAAEPSVTPIVSSVVASPVQQADVSSDERTTETLRAGREVPAEPLPPVAEPRAAFMVPAPAVASAPPPAPPVTAPIDAGGGLAAVPLPAATSGSIEAPARVEPPVDERARVRAVLARYEAAYSGLSAAAAQDVWPGVDVRALERAFDALAAQRLSLGRCDLAITGASARADCSGTATWTPKVGGGGRTENRRWEFELAKSGDDWRITRAIAR